MIQLIRSGLLTATLLVSSLASAQVTTQDNEAPHVAVRYGDLNLATSAGIHVLYQRIQRAAQAVCPYADSDDLKQSGIYRTCREAAITRAISEINNSQLVALRAEHEKRG